MKIKTMQNMGETFFFLYSSCGIIPLFLNKRDKNQIPVFHFFSPFLINFPWNDMWGRSPVASHCRDPLWVATRVGRKGQRMSKGKKVESSGLKLWARREGLR